MSLNVRPITDADRPWVRDLMAERWGSDLIVGHGERFYPHELPGFVVEANGEPVGLITYTVEGSSCEIVTIDALRQGAGIGTRLIEAVKEVARREGRDRLWLITTNDNLDALRFYQTRGFHLAGINLNAIEQSRKIKPEISEIGNYGIPIRDEIVLEMSLTNPHPPAPSPVSGRGGGSQGRTPLGDGVDYGDGFRQHFKLITHNSQAMIHNALRPVGLGLAARGDVRDTVGYALKAEQMGFESVWVHDSYFERDPITYLASIAAEVQTMRVGAGALNPYTRHPVVLAMTGSGLDDLAPGRFSMALGSGLPLRLSQMNIPYDDTVAEVSRTIDMLRTLWAGDPLKLNPAVPPLQPMFQPPHHIPLYIAGYQGRFLDLCGEKADGYLARPAESIPAFRLMKARVRRSAETHGRSPDAIVFSGYVLALVEDTRRAALNRAKREPFVIYMMSVLSNVSLQRAGLPPELRDQIAAAWRAEEYHQAGQLIPDELLDAFLACGTRDEVAEKMLEYHEAGMDVPLIQPILQEEEQVQAVLEAGVLYATGQAVGERSRGASARAANAAPDDSEEVASVPADRPGVVPLDGPRPGLARRAQRHVQAWYEILRPFSFTASVVPILAGGAIAWADKRFALGIFLLVLVGGVALQAGTNIINEIYDVRHGIDKITSPRASHALLKGALTEREAFTLAFTAFGLTALIGVVLVILRGWPMLLLGLAGLLGGYSYTAPPFQYKYRALGVPLVFVLMGPLMVIGSYYAITGHYTPAALYASVPIGLLVAAILHANEWRDISEDARTGFRTLSASIGAEGAHRVYLGLVTGAYLAIGVAAMGHLLPASTLLVMLSLPVFVSVLRASELGSTGQVRALAMIDLATARLHMIFGFLLVIGLFLARYVH